MYLGNMGPSNVSKRLASSPEQVKIKQAIRAAKYEKGVPRGINQYRPLDICRSEKLVMST